MDGSHHLLLTRRRTGPDLRGLVAGMVGMSESAPGVVERRQPASSLLPLVLSLGDPLEVVARSEGTGAGQSYRSFVSGFTSGYADTRFRSGQECVQVYLTPLGVGRVLGLPGRAVADQVVPLDDIPGLRVEELLDRLSAVRTWQDRLTLVEEVVQGHVRASTEAPGWVLRMWQQIWDRGGQVRVSDLVARTGWSHRHVVAVFTEHVGLTPKQASDVVRIEHATHDLGRLSLAEVATRHGYADQSHLSRAAARHAGDTPGRLARAPRPTPATALGRWPG